MMKKILDTPAYAFLHNNKRLDTHLIFLVVSGSLAYGTNIDTSDIDLRGCALNTAQDLLGFSNFEHYTDIHTDTTIYGFNKLIRLLTSCNPNAIELLGCKNDHYLLMHPIGEQLIANNKMFLSQRAVHAFSSYAAQQLRRLQNALARDHYPQSEKEQHIKNSVLNAMQSFSDRYQSFDHGAINLYIDQAQNPDLDMELFVDVSLKKYPLRDYKNIWSDMSNIITDYEKLNKRNHKKDDAHLNKHAMHLIRLYYMCIDILEKQDIITYREHEHDLLLSIRTGAFQNSDGSYQPEFFELVDSLEKRVAYAAKNTALAPEPDAKQIEEFAMSVNRQVILNEK